eukprot:2641958-Prymnesium_polylepis.1
MPLLCCSRLVASQRVQRIAPRPVVGDCGPVLTKVAVEVASDSVSVHCGDSWMPTRCIAHDPGNSMQVRLEE